MKIRSFNRRLLILAVVIASLGLLLLPQNPQKYFLINQTDSVPIGLYRLVPDRTFKVGDIIAFYPPPTVRSMMIERGYIGKETSLMKMVAATAGDHFCIDGSGNFSIMDQHMGTAKIQDSAGRALPALRGCYTLGSNEYLVLGFGTGSFDSRYFGAISPQEILGKAEPIFNWDPKGNFQKIDELKKVVGRKVKSEAKAKAR